MIDSMGSTTKYLGMYQIEAKNVIEVSHGSEELHLFYNEHSFLDLEESRVEEAKHNEDSAHDGADVDQEARQGHVLLGEHHAYW